MEQMVNIANADRDGAENIVNWTWMNAKRG